MSQQQRPFDGVKLNRTVIGLVVAILVQVGAMIAWGSGLNMRVQFIQEQLADIKSAMSEASRASYSASDASKDKELYLRLFESNQARIEKLEQAHELRP